MPDVVRMLFGCSGGMFGCTQEKCEESPNKVSSNTGTRPDRYRFQLQLSRTKITLHLGVLNWRELYSVT